MYDEGQGVTQDDKAAFEWFKKAAEQGYAKAQNSLGVMYSEGQGVTQDDKVAFMWYQKGQNKGTHLPNTIWDYCMRKDRVLPRTIRLRSFGSRKSVEQGHADARSQVAKMYFFGEGVDQDLKAAFEWWTKQYSKKN